MRPKGQAAAGREGRMGGKGKDLGGRRAQVAEGPSLRPGSHQTPAGSSPSMSASPCPSCATVPYLNRQPAPPHTAHPASPPPLEPLSCGAGRDKSYPPMPAGSCSRHPDGGSLDLEKRRLNQRKHSLGSSSPPSALLLSQPALALCQGQSYILSTLHTSHHLPHSERPTCQRPPK